MEIAAEYNAPLVGGIRWQVYAAPAGEPALGPVAFPHRMSAMPNPLAPIAHHWLDSTHITFGVITGGLYGARWKAEGSIFNGREPDENRTNFDFGPLDSVSGRAWFLPTPNWALQMSVGRLTEAEPSEHGGPGIDVTRTTASATYHRVFRPASIWATTLAWGRNAEPDHASNAVLLETNLTFDDRDTWFGRFEIVGKSAHDLAVAESPDDFAVSKLQGGYTRYLHVWSKLATRSGRHGLGRFRPGTVAGDLWWASQPRIRRVSDAPTGRHDDGWRAAVDQSGDGDGADGARSGEAVLFAHDRPQGGRHDDVSGRDLLLLFGDGP